MAAGGQQDAQSFGLAMFNGLEECWLCVELCVPHEGYVAGFPPASWTGKLTDVVKHIKTELWSFRAADVAYCRENVSKESSGCHARPPRVALAATEDTGRGPCGMFGKVLLVVNLRTV
jgi:hypothetical protein